MPTLFHALLPGDSSARYSSFYHYYDLRCSAITCSVMIPVAVVPREFVLPDLLCGG
jgi:hypothetical protein